MTIGYFEIAVKCKKCGKSYLPRREQRKCPHNFKDKLSRIYVGQERGANP